MRTLIFDRYLLKSLAIATAFTGVVLASVILLTQSLRFLELVIDSGASSAAFWMLAALALPRFFEVILPLALAVSILFVYNRMSVDSEIVVMRSAGLSPFRLSFPAFLTAGWVTVILIVVTTWLAPVSLAGMQQMRQVIKAQYSAFLFREGVFNAIGDNVTVYVGGRGADGQLEDLLIHDSREEGAAPSTIIARRGVIVTGEDGQRVVVFDGSRQQMNLKTGALSRLAFERYSLDLPDSEPVRQRWREPDERTFPELLNPDPAVMRDVENKRRFMVEAHRRIVSPFLALGFAAICVAFLLTGPSDRRGQGGRISLAVLSVVAIQGFYLAACNLAAEESWGLIPMYIIAFGPLAGGIYVLTRAAGNGIFAARKTGEEMPA